MKTKFFFILSISLIVSLAACSSPPEPVEPSAQEAEEAQQESVLEQVDNTTEEVQTNNSQPAAEASDPIVEPETVVDPIEPTIEPIPQDYPTPEPAVAESYPEPEAVVNSGYPEPEAVADIAENEPVSREVQIAMPGEFYLVGTLNTDGADSAQPGVLLLHMLGGKRSDWDGAGFNQILNSEGYATLALDLRGHGDSVSAVDWALAEEDLNLVWEWFISQPEIDGENSMIIGASIGSNLALRTAVNQPSVKAAVLLSPGLNYREVTTDDAIATIDRPVLMVAMTQDSYSADSVTQLNEINPDNTIAMIQEGSAHGTRMFGVYTGLEAFILDFLSSNQG